MNQQILNRTQSKLKQNQTMGTHSWVFHGVNYTRQYTVLPGVFSPAIFLGTQWLTNQILSRVQANESFLEIGCGAGVTSIQLALSKGNQIICCSDINPCAVENTRQNAYQKYQTKIQIYLSDLYTSIPKNKYDVIYWNYPFHPSDKSYESLTMLEKAVRDPGYEVLSKFLKQTDNFLAQNGRVYLGFSLTMGNIEELTKICEKYEYFYQIVNKMGVEQKGTICLISLHKFHKS